MYSQTFRPFATPSSFENEHMSPAAFICYQHHWTIKIHYAGKIKLCVCVCALQYQSLSRLYCVCLGAGGFASVGLPLRYRSSALLWCYESRGPSQQEATGITRLSRGPRLAVRHLSELTENTDTTRSEPCSPALSFQVRFSWKITI